MSATFGLPNPVALVTGSVAPRVGRVIAEHLASLGCRIAVHGRKDEERAQTAAEEIASTHDVETLALVGDLGDAAISEGLANQTADHFGRLDIVVNSAAIWSPTPLDEIDADEIRHYFNINAIAPLLLSRAAAQIMRDQDRGGCVIQISDWATVRPYLDHAAYFPSKGAIEVITRNLAVELAQWNRSIRVNCVCPGPVLLADDVDEATRDQLAAATLLGRVGTPESIAHAVQFLCVNDFVTGVCLPVDGGRQVFAPDGLQVGKNTG
ncbi:MAG: SDR family oxidoreductase [Planctomycetota bacterium]